MLGDLAPCVDRTALLTALDVLCGSVVAVDRVPQGVTPTSAFRVYGEHRDAFIKVADDVSAVSRVGDEALALQRWADTGLAPACHTTGTGFVIMDLVPGSSVETWDPQMLYDAVDLLRQISSAVVSTAPHTMVRFTDNLVTTLPEIPPRMRAAGEEFMDDLRFRRDVPVHGDAHRLNWMVSHPPPIAPPATTPPTTQPATAPKVRLIDWEMSTDGPRGWDMSHLIIDAPTVDVSTRLGFLLSQVSTDHARALMTAFWMKSAAAQHRLEPRHVVWAAQRLEQIELLYTQLERC